MVHDCPPERAQECPWTSSWCSPQVLPLTHLCLTCVNLHKSTSLCSRRWFVCNTGFYYQPSTPAKASPALYLLLIGMKRLVITGILVGRCLLPWVSIQEMEEECTDRPTSQRIKLSVVCIVQPEEPNFQQCSFLLSCSCLHFEISLIWRCPCKIAWRQMISSVPIMYLALSGR